MKKLYIAVAILVAVALTEGCRKQQLASEATQAVSLYKAG